mgnify:CR=1 FL=1
MSIKCSCGHDNPPGSVFCEDCGLKLSGGLQPQYSGGGPQPQYTYSLNFKNNVIEATEQTRTFGRQDFSKYLPKEEYQFISHPHFTISRENDKFFIQDGGEKSGAWKDSTNGTSLNGTPIKGAGKKELKDNDKISVADTVELQFVIKK